MTNSKANCQNRLMNGPSTEILRLLPGATSTGRGDVFRGKIRLSNEGNDQATVAKNKLTPRYIFLQFLNPGYVNYTSSINIGNLTNCTENGYG